MRKYKGKKGDPEKEAWGRYYKSKTFKRLFLIKYAAKAYATFLNEFKKLHRSSAKDFYNKWLQNLKLPIQIGGRTKQGKFEVMLQPLVSLSETTYRHLLPVITWNTQKILGVPPVKSGRTNNLDRNKSIRKLYKQFKKLSIDNRLEKIRKEVPAVKNLCDDTLLHIVRSKKYNQP